MNTTYLNRRRGWLVSLTGVSDPAYRRWLRWRKWVIIGFLACLTILFIVWLVGGKFLTIKEVVVVQQVRSQPDVMPMGSIDQKAVGWRGRWLWTDTSAMQQEILQEFPAVSKAEVSVEFPDRLTVALLPRVAICQLVTPDGVFLVDKSGLVFGQVGEPVSFLPTLQTDSKPEVGKTISTSGLRLALALVTTIRGADRSISQVTMHDGQLDVLLNGPPRILLADQRSPEKSVEEIGALLASFAQQQRYPVEIDMRFDRPVLRY